MYYNNGDLYDGDWKNDNPEGKWKKYWHNGDSFEGEVINDKKPRKKEYIIGLVVINMKEIRLMMLQMEKEFFIL